MTDRFSIWHIGNHLTLEAIYKLRDARLWSDGATVVYNGYYRFVAIIRDGAMRDEMRVMYLAHRMISS